MYKDNFFDININIFKTSGVWFLNYDNTWKNIIFFIYNVYAVFYALIFFQCAEIFFIVSDTSDIRVLVKNVAWSLTHTLLTYKVFLWFYKRHIVMSIRYTLLKPEYYYPDTKYFKASEILKNFSSTNNKFMGTYFIVGGLIPVSALVGNIYGLIFDPESMNGIDEFGNVTFCEKLPFPSYTPFEINTYFKCGLASFLQCQGILIFGFMIISLDGMFISNMCFLTAHINVLLQAFKTVRGRTILFMEENNISECHLNKYLKIEMNKCIYYLQTIMKMCEKLESVYKYQTLGQSLGCLLDFCINLYLVSSISVEDKSFMSDITYMLAVGFEFFLYCWFGNELTLASNKINQAMYESEWTILPIEIQKSILITMIRMKKPILFTVGMFSPLSLETFVAILKSSYSFFAVLKQVNE